MGIFIEPFECHLRRVDITRMPLVDSTIMNDVPPHPSCVYPGTGPCGHIGSDGWMDGLKYNPSPVLNSSRSETGQFTVTTLGPHGVTAFPAPGTRHVPRHRFAIPGIRKSYVSLPCIEIFQLERPRCWWQRYL